MDNHLNQVSQFFRQQGSPGGFRVLDDKASKPPLHTQQNEIAKIIPTPSTQKSQSKQGAVVNKPKHSTRPSSTSPNSSCSDSVKSLILKLNAVKQRQQKARRKTVPPYYVPQKRIPMVSESKVSVQPASFLEQMFMSNENLVLPQPVRHRKSSVEAACATSKSNIAASNRVASSSTKQLLMSKSGKPALAETQPLQSGTCRKRSVGEPRVTPLIDMTGSSKAAPLSLEDWFLSNSCGPLPPVPSRRRSAEQARLAPQVPVVAPHGAGPSDAVPNHCLQSANNLRKSVQNVGSLALPSEPHCKETPPSDEELKCLVKEHSSVESLTQFSPGRSDVQVLDPELIKQPLTKEPVVTIRRLGDVKRKPMASNHQFREQGRSDHELPLRAKSEKSPNECKYRSFGGEEKDHSDDSSPVHTERHSERYQPPSKSKRTASVSARKTNVNSTKEAKGDNLQSKKNVRETRKEKTKARSKKNSKSSVLSKKRVLNNHSRSTQKTKQSRKTGPENIDVWSRKSSNNYTQRDVDPILKSTTKKTTKHTTSKKNSNSRSQRALKSTKKGPSKTAVGSKRATSSKESESQSRKRIRKSAPKTNNCASDEDDSGLEKSHSSGGSIFTLSELEHACNTLVPFSEIQQLEERLHRGPVATSTRVTGSHFSLGSIFDTRIHPGGVWKSIIDES